MADKQKRIQQLIKKNLSQIIIYELDNNVTQFVSINDVNFNKDSSLCKVYVSNIDQSKLPSIVNYLNNNKGKIKTLLAKSLDIYKIPDLIFIVDEKMEQDAKLDEMIDKVNNSKPKTLKDVYGKDFKIND